MKRVVIKYNYDMALCNWIKGVSCDKYNFVDKYISFCYLLNGFHRPTSSKIYIAYTPFHCHLSFEFFHTILGDSPYLDRIFQNLVTLLNKLQTHVTCASFDRQTKHPINVYFLSRVCT